MLHVQQCVISELWRYSYKGFGIRKTANQKQFYHVKTEGVSNTAGKHEVNRVGTLRSNIDNLKNSMEIAK